ncbi:MAG: hypothetical protein ABIB11_01190 [Candidatus Omnitrophota bacterium]
MEFLLITLNKEEYFEKIVSLLVEAGVEGATIVDAEAVGHFLAHEVPIFAGLRQLVGEAKTLSKVITALLEDDNSFSVFKKLLEEEEIDFTKPDVGYVITVPVSKAIKPEA